MVSVTMFNSGCEKENLEVDSCPNANCKYVFYKDMEDYNNRLREISTMTRDERLSYELSQGYESFGSYCEKFYESIVPEDYQTLDEVVAFVNKNKEYLELSEDENGEYTVEIIDRNNIERYMYGVNKIFVIKDSAYKVLGKQLVVCDVKKVASLTKINDENYMSYVNNSEYSFIDVNRNSSYIYHKDAAVNNGMYEKIEKTNGDNRTRIERIIEMRNPFFEGAATCYAGVKVRPLKKTGVAWFYCIRTITLNTKFYVHGRLNNTWYESPLYQYNHTEKKSVLEYSIVFPSPRYLDEAHFGRVYAYGSTPSAGPAVINHW